MKGGRDAGAEAERSPGVRLDLFLRNTGLVKQRPLAQDVCDAGRILLDGKPARAATRVRAGQVLTLDLPWRYFEAEILRVPARAVARGERDACWRVIRDEGRTDVPNEGPMIS